MNIIVKSIFEDQYVFLAVITSFMVSVAFLASSLTDDSTILIIPLFIYGVLIFGIIIFSWFEKFFKLDYFTKILTIFIVLSIANILFVYISFLTSAISSYNLNPFILPSFYWIIIYYLFAIYVNSQFDTPPILKSEVNSDEGFTHSLILPWIIFTLFAMVTGGILSYLDRFSYESLIQIPFILIFSLPIIYILNEIYWVPKSGVATLIQKRRRIQHGERDLTTPEEVIISYKHNEISAEEYYDSLIKMKEEMYSAPNIERIYYVNDIINVSRNLGLKGKKGKILAMYLLPSMLNKWRIFALLPKHLQRISHDFLEMLLLIGEANDEWRKIIFNEVEKRISAKLRFSLFSNSPIPPSTGIQEWTLQWDNKVYRGRNGYKVAKERYWSNIKDINSIHSRLKMSEWEKDLEDATIKVMKTFFGLDSRGAWGKSVEKGSYNLHEFIVRGGKLSEYDPAIPIPGPPQEIPLMGSIKTQSEPEDIEYLIEYINTGKLPQSKTVKKYLESESRIFRKKNKTFFAFLLIVTALVGFVTIHSILG